MTHGETMRGLRDAVCRRTWEKRIFCSHRCHQWERRRFCSTRCAGRRSRPWRQHDHTPKVCANCGQTFERGKTSDALWEARRFCSLRCARTGEHHPNWKGGRSVDFKGYVRVWLADDHPYAEVRTPGRNFALEHRLVLAEHLGRPLFSYEQVHHKNGNRKDNRIENLELRIGAHGTGATHAHCPTCTCFED